MKLCYADGRWYFHNGIDIAVERGTEVLASTSGKVRCMSYTFLFLKMSQLRDFLSDSLNLLMLQLLQL